MRPDGVGRLSVKEDAPRGAAPERRVLRVTRFVPASLRLLVLLLLVLVFLLWVFPAQSALADDPAISAIESADHYETAIMVSKKSHPGGATAVFLAKCDDFPEQLGAGRRITAWFSWCASSRARRR